MKITAIVLTKNEEKSIERCLKSIMFCDEIVVVDDYSTENIIEKIRNPKSEIRNKSKIQIFKKKLNENFAEQRNFGMEKASNEWILFVDADETISGELRSEIELKVKNEKLKVEDAAFYLKRRDYFWGKELKYGETKKIRENGLIRLVKKGSGTWDGSVHEEYKINDLALNTKQLTNFINHYPHQTVKEFLGKVNFYSTLRAKELERQGRSTNIFEIIVFPLGKFIYTYFFKLGFLDGAAGFVYSFMMSLHSFLVRAKLYQYKKIASPK